MAINIKYLKSGEMTERSTHQLIIQWIKNNPEISPYIFHIPNEGKRSYNHGRIMKAMGIRAGVSDLFIAMGRHGYIGAWIELKTSVGKLSDVQKQFRYDMNSQGYYTDICRSYDEAIKTISWYCFDDKSLRVIRRLHGMCY